MMLLQQATSNVPGQVRNLQDFYSRRSANQTFGSVPAFKVIITYLIWLDQHNASSMRALLLSYI